MNSDEPQKIRSYERERVDASRIEKKHLRRLSGEFYRGHAFVHWTLAIENRATGWLTPNFHHEWKLFLLHTCARYDLACPAYVLMPDHAHVVWLGLNEHGSDQRVGVEFLRKHLRPSLAPADWQHQPFDHFLDEAERQHGAFSSAAHYLFENAVRAGLVIDWRDYPFTGCAIAGYPALNVRQDNYWELFWRIYNRLIETYRSTRSRS